MMLLWLAHRGMRAGLQNDVIKALPLPFMFLSIIKGSREKS